MDNKTTSAPNGSACELCHKRKVRCDLYTGRFPCTHCESVNHSCVLHRRKRKHDPLLSPTASKRLGIRPALESPSEQRQPACVRSPESTNDRLTALEIEETSPGSYLGRAEYVSGTVPIDEKDARRYSSGRNATLADEDKRYLIDIRALDLPTRSIYDSLISSFFEHCYPWMPIVEPNELRASESFQPSTLLLQSVFVAASRVSLAPEARASGDNFYRKAKALYHLGFEKNPMNIVRSVCLILWFNNSGPEHISLDASSFWLHMGVALAHQLGLHREPNSKLPDAKLRRRLWWTLFIRDCQIATSHGRPRTINAEDCNVRPLKLQDFATSNDDAILFIAYQEICSILTSLTESLVRGTLGWSTQMSIEMRLYSWIRDLPDAVRICNKSDGSLLPYNFKSRQLNLMFFTAIMLLYRPKSPAGQPSGAAILASSFSAGIFEDFLARGELGYLAPVFNFHLMTAAYAQLACYKYPAMWSKAEGELDTICTCLVEMAKRYPTAVGAQRVIKAVFRAVKVQKRYDEVALVTSEPEQMKFFNFLGPDLCNKWVLIKPNHHANTPRPLGICQTTDANELTRPRDISQGTTHPILTEANSSSQLPTGQYFEEVQPFGNSLFRDVCGHDSYFASNGAFTAVGNWMLGGDWTADIDWTGGEFGA